MQRLPLLLTLLCLALFPSLRAIAAEAAPAPMKLDPSWLQPSKMTDAPEFKADGMRAIFYDGVPWKGQPTRVFAWIGLPKAEPANAGRKFPAMVLVHGGGGTAFEAWVRLWTGRGYAAIAMDTCGQVPRGKYSHWERDPQGGPPGWGGFEHVDDPPSDQWTYHAVADVVLAHSLIRSLPEVDAERRGITGISWGGYLTCIVAGVDERFQFAAPVYGCGFLGDNSVWLPEFQKLGEKSKLWLGMWDPSRYLPDARMPILWVDGTNDFAYPLDSVQKSYRLPQGPRTLCTRVRMPHGHGGAGENPAEIHAFAESILNGAAPLAKVTKQGNESGTAWARFESPRPIVKAELNYTKDTGVWQKRKWESAPAQVDAKASEVRAKLPDGTRVYYLNLIDERGLIVSTQHEELSPRTSAARDVERVLVVRNDDSPVSCAVANDYSKRRGIANLLAIHCPDSAAGADKETISFAAYQKSIESPLREFLASHPSIDFIVLTKGVPIRIKDAPGRGAGGKRPSLDSFLAALDYAAIPDAITIDVKDGGFTGIAWANRFWDAHEPFSHARFGGYLVTRLDGYTEADAIALTTRALEAEKAPPTGSILLDTCPTFGFADAKHQPASLLKKPALAGKGTELGELNYNEYNADMRSAADLLKARGLPVELDLADQFIGDRTALMGYVSWGSNDRHFDAKAYHQLRFAPGSLCETAVSTSARTFLATKGGQSLIADLVAEGATGAKGYTDEPLLQAIASPTILFDRYTHGWTLAESYYAASRFVGWEDIVLGDPLCRAYSK